MNLSVDERGRTRCTRENFLAVLSSDPAFADVRMNMLTGLPERDSEPWTDADEAAARIHIESEYGISSPTKFDDALSVFLHQREYDPLQDMLNGLRWDGVSRVGSMLVRWMGADDSAYNAEVERLMFAGGVNRAFSPGCKFDYLPVLIGRQGCGKTSFVRELSMGFYASLTTIDPQKAVEQTSGAWLVELEELAALTDGHGRRVNPAQVKQFISMQDFTYRRPYGRTPTTVKRRCLFIATTNDEAFLDDPTGGRRFLPVQVCGDAARLYAERETLSYELAQAWAEMTKAYKTGDPLANPAPRRELAREFTAAQEAAQVDDWRVGVLRDWLPNFDRVCISQCVEYLQSFDRSISQSNRLSREIGQMLTNVFGWRRSGLARFDGYGVQREFCNIPCENVTQCYTNVTPAKP